MKAFACVLQRTQHTLLNSILGTGEHLLQNQEDCSEEEYAVHAATCMHKLQ